MKRRVILALRVVTVDEVKTFRGSVVALAFLASHGLPTERNSIRLESLTFPIQRKRSVALVDDDTIG